MNPKILVVDDESHILNVVSLKLRNAGYSVVTATDGGEALEKAQQEQPAMIITDFHMPRMSGLALCQRLHDDPAWQTPAILLTARGNELTSADLKSGGIIEVVSKPFSPRQLLVAVQSHLAAA